MRTAPSAAVGREAKAAIVNILADGPGTAAPLRIIAYGDSLTAGSPSMEPYAKAMAQALWDAGIHVEVTVCGLNAMTAEQMLLLAEEPDVHDMMSRWGHGLAHLIRPKRGAWRAADLVLIMAGTNDLGRTSSRPMDIFSAVRGLHELCHAEGARTVALAIPDAGGAADSMTMAPDIRMRRRAANAAIAAWARSSNKDDLSCKKLASLTRPELFVNIGALMPYGPLARAAGFWEKDGVHFTAAGSCVLGQRLAFKLRGLVSALQRSLLREGRGLPSIDDGAADTSAKLAPTLEAYLAAFALEDEAAAHVEAVEGQQEVPDWELDAVSLLQAWRLGKRILKPHSGQVLCNSHRVPLSGEPTLSSAVSKPESVSVLEPAAPPVTAPVTVPGAAASSAAATGVLRDACAAISAAAASGDTAALKEAIARAKRVGVPKKEIARANALGQH